MVPLILLVAVAAAQIVGLARARVELQAAARDGARVAATTPDPAKAVAAALAALPEETRARARVSVERPSRVGVPATVRITVRHLIGRPFPSGLGVDIVAEASMRTER